MNSNVHPATRRGWFKAGAIGLLLFGGVHLLAVYRGFTAEPATPAEVELHRALLGLKLDMGPIHTTAWHTTMILNSSYSVLLLYAGVLNLVTLGPVSVAGRLRGLTLANIVFSGILALITLVLQFPPPFVFAAACCTLFTVSFVRQGAARAPAMKA